NQNKIDKFIYYSEIYMENITNAFKLLIQNNNNNNNNYEIDIIINNSLKFLYLSSSIYYFQFDYNKICEIFPQFQKLINFNLLDLFENNNIIDFSCINPMDYL